jgi:hypothetical protein
MKQRLDIPGNKQDQFKFSCWNLRNAAVLLILMLEQDVFFEPRSARRPEVA